MKLELKNNLAEEFTFMREEIDTGDGWYQLLYDMCKEIEEVLETAEKPVQIVVDQIKEKYGTLNFYYHLEGVGRDDVHQRISDIVEKYEDKSEEICETCGCKGTGRTDLIWVQTLCDTCYSKCAALEELRKNGRDNTELEEGFCIGIPFEDKKY